MVNVGTWKDNFVLAKTICIYTTFMRLLIRCNLLHVENMNKFMCYTGDTKPK